MRKHSETAWNIASLYSGVLASETRDLAAHIDAALAEDRAEIERLKKMIESKDEMIRKLLPPQFRDWEPE